MAQSLSEEAILGAALLHNEDAILGAALCVEGAPAMDSYHSSNGRPPPVLRPGFGIHFGGARPPVLVRESFEATHIDR